MGLNEEMTGPIYLHPYRLLSVDPSTPRWSECSEGFFAQSIRPVFGICFGERPLPLLFRQYIPAWPYWPLWWIGTHVAGFVPLLVNAIPALIAGALLGLMALQVCRNDDVWLASMSVAGIAWFPFATLYASLYLFESLPVAALFAVWWLLDRHNRDGRTAPLALAGLVTGFACHQKLTSVLAFAPFVAAHLAVFGCRRLTFRKVMLVLAATAAFPLIGAVINLVYAARTGFPVSFMALSAQASALHMIVAASYWTFAALPSEQFSAFDAARMVSFAALIAYCGWLVFAHLRRTPQPRVEVLAAITLVGTLIPTIAVYRYNPTSMPSFTLLPFVAMVIAGIFRRASHRLGRLCGDRIARAALVTGFAAPTIGLAVVRWPATFSFATQRMSIPTFSDQRYAADWLTERDVTEPLLLTFHENGVLEFLSGGRIRPIYVNERQCERVGGDEWERILAATRDRQVDILVAAPYYAQQQLGRYCSAGAAGELAAVLRRSRRRSTETLLSTPLHTWDFMLFSVAPEDGAPPS